MDEIAIIARDALPCPFCGERLVIHTDYHGAWVAHKREPGPCIDSVTQLHDLSDLLQWNVRNGEHVHVYSVKQGDDQNLYCACGHVSKPLSSEGTGQ